jgi:hypothetical protein
LFSELQFTTVDDPRNPSIFGEIVSYVEHKSVEVSAACGGVLSMLARRMSDVEKATLAESLSTEQKKALVAVLPLETHDGLDFESFNKMSPAEKVKTCRLLLDRLRASAPAIQSTADFALSVLLKELSCQETDWAAMKLIIFSLHSLLLHCTFRAPELKTTLLSVTFFSNRWQRKLVLLDGLSQTINSILFKLFEKIPPIQIFTTLLEGMSRFKGAIPSDSFYCKCWIIVSNQLNELMQPGDAPQIVQFATEKHQEFGNDVRGKLCQALALTASGKKPPPLKSEETAKTAIISRSQSPTKKTPSSSEQHGVPEAVPIVTSRLETKQSPKKSRAILSTEQESLKPAVTSDKVPVTTAPPVEESTGERPQNRRPAETNQVAELKSRLQQLRQRWK